MILKSVLEQLAPSTDDSVDKLMHSHNLRAIYDKSHAIESAVNLDRRALAMLKDYYFDAKYPGDSFVTVTKEECTENIGIMYDVIEEVNRFRKCNNLPVVEVKRQGLS